VIDAGIGDQVGDGVERSVDGGAERGVRGRKVVDRPAERQHEGPEAPKVGDGRRERLHRQTEVPGQRRKKVGVAVAHGSGQMVWYARSATPCIRGSRLSIRMYRQTGQNA
jgi:hypothetical protein